MNKYGIILTRDNKSFLEEFIVYNCDNLEQAKKEASFFSEDLSKGETITLVKLKDYLNGDFTPLKF